MPSESQFLFANQLVPWHGSRDLGPWYIRQPQTFPVLKRTPSFRCKWETREEEKIRPGVQASAMEACLFHWLFVGNRCLCVYVNVNVCMCVYIYLCVHVCTCVCMCVYIMSVYAYVCLSVCMCVCVRTFCLYACCIMIWYRVHSARSTKFAKKDVDLIAYRIYLNLSYYTCYESHIFLSPTLST